MARGSVDDFLNQLDTRIEELEDVSESQYIGTAVDPYSNREYKFAERFADHVCDKMYDDFGYYTEADVDTLTRGIDFYVYEGETAQGEPLITYTVSSEDLDFTENKMATEVSYVCNDIEDAIRRLNK